MMNFNGRINLNYYNAKGSYGRGLYNSKFKPSPIPPPQGGYLLQEDGFAILQENGGYILIE